MADINGTAGADLLFGAAAADLISGGDGNDLIYGGAGDDELSGGEGDDVLQGEGGDDRLDGGAGNDSLSSTDFGDDTLIGGEGNDTLHATRTYAGDTLVLDGGSGNDRLVVDLDVAASGVTLAAGSGDDSVEIFGVRSSLALSLGTGRDLVTLIDFRSSVQAGGRVAISDFEAGAAGDRISLSSLTASDFTNWSPAVNPFAAGYLSATQSGADVVISASFAANGTFVEAVVLRNVLLSSLTPDNLGGWTWDGSSVPAQIINGTGAAETLRGNGGADDIYGGDGDDILEGHAGSDMLWGGEGNDILRGGQGIDQLHGGAGNDMMSADSAGEMLYGEDGDDRLTMSVAAGAAAGSLGALGGAGNDTIVISGPSTTASFGADGGAGNDLVAITTLANTASITLGDGRDRLDLDSWQRPTNSIATIEVTDFATGDDGDRLDWTGFLLRSVPGGWGSDLYGAGVVRLLQSGPDTLLQIDLNGGGDQFVTLISFRSTTATAFTTYNLGGIGPAGLPEEGATITGTDASEHVFGTDGGDLIEGLDGRDVLHGFHGDDTLQGGAGDDLLVGYDGDDVLDGGDGNDVLNPGRGDDLIDGGEGNDILVDSGSGSKGFVGGAGDDSVSFYRSYGGDTFVAAGGDGNDFFSADTGGNFGSLIILDGGAGNDVFEVAGHSDLTLGEGQDRLRIIDRPWPGEPPILVRDFAAGDSGDRLELSALFRHFTNFDRSANPFLTGHLRLSGTGSDSYLEADPDGAGGSGSTLFLATLLGAARYSLTSHNLGGYSTPWSFGTAADETFQGDGGLNEFVGGGGNDTFLIGFGGRDVAIGGPGNDLFYAAVGAAYWPIVNVTGGGGTDILQIHGKSNETRLTLQVGTSGLYDAVGATGIATVQFLSGFDSSRGWAFDAPLKYAITLGRGFAPTGAPLVIDTTRLAASESFSLQDSSSPDGDDFITLIGGPGADRVQAGAGGTHLSGGSGDDELYTGLGDDTLLGGAGADKLYAIVGQARSGTDYLDGGEGNDTLSLTGNGGGASTSVKIEGGAGDDIQIIGVAYGAAMGVADIDLGTGSDRLQLGMAGGTFNVTLGADRDTIEMVSAVGGPGVSIVDFDPGPEGDQLVWQTALNSYLGNYSWGMNPFQSNHARLVQDGGDVLLQISRVADGSFMTALRFKNHVVADFAGGVGGFLPVPPNGTIGDDVLIGTDGRDDFDGKAGNDVLDGRGGADRLAGGPGDDILYVDDVNDQVVEGSNGGVDEVRTSLASFSLGSLYEVERLRGISDSGQTLNGNVLANTLVGGGGNDVLTGDSGQDVLDGGPGADTMRGGSDSDVYFVDHVNDLVEEYWGGGTDEVRTSLASYTLGAYVEKLVATSDIAHRFRGNSDFNQLVGGAGNDVFLLQDGADDFASGGDGNDVFYFGTALSGGDVAIGGPGRDAIVLQGNVTAVLANSNLATVESISIQSGANSFFGDTANNFYDYSVTTANGNVAAGEQLIVNAQSLRIGEDFTFDGSAEKDGKFVVYGGHGTDDLTGGDGADVFFFEGQRWGPSDKVDGGAGRDSVAISAGNGLNRIEFGADSLTGIESISVNNFFATDPSQKPSYDLVLHNGNVAAGSTLIVNGSSIPGGQVVNIDGRGVHDGNLILFGGGGHDIVIGGDGADTILGGGGADSLGGGAGADVFRYDSASDSTAAGADLLGDFQAGVDRIDLGRVDSNTHADGNQAFTFIGSNAFSGTGAVSAGQLRFRDDGGYRWVEGDTDGDGNADFTIAFYAASAPQGAGDFLL